MGSDATKRRAELVAEVEGHADPMVKEAVAVLLQVDVGYFRSRT